jgi:hypothetical protein
MPCSQRSRRSPLQVSVLLAFGIRHSASSEGRFNEGLENRGISGGAKRSRALRSVCLPPFENREGCGSLVRCTAKGGPTRQALSSFSLFSTAFQLPLVCVPPCQPVTFALAHVHFQFVSNSAGSSAIPCSQQEKRMAIRRNRILALDFGFFRAELLRGQFLKRIDLARLRVDKIL